METSDTNGIHPLQKDRKRTNLLRGIEQPVLLFLCRKMPGWVSPDMLTGLGLVGSFIVMLGFILAKDNSQYLLLSVFGFAVQWVGDSLDGRIAVYRDIPRKWYGFSLDLCMDWITTILVCIGFYYFLPDNYKILSITYMGAYAWIMMLTLLKYKITDEYNIDSGLLGPTELRLAICVVLFIESFFTGTFLIFAIVVNVVVLIIDFVEFYKILQLGNKRDEAERNQT